MNNKLLTDSTKDILSHTSNILKSDNIWLWFALISFVMIVLIVLFSKNTKSIKQLDKAKFKGEIQSSEIDFGNIVNSSFNAKPLYDELKVRCHPDRFSPDEEKTKIANLLFQDITKNKNNFKKLVEIKEQAIDKLNVTF